MPGGRRSPQQRALRELARVRRVVGHRHPLSLDEAVDISGRISRRDVLLLGGVAGAAFVLAGCTRGSRLPTPILTPSEEPRIVIVGAGLAGLTAVHRLHQVGLACSVFEARDRVGGRCWRARGFAGSYAAFTPGQITSFWGLTGEAEGTVHFAGEHTSTFSQGYLNGGVESGSRGAAEILAALGLPQPPALRETFRVARRFAPRYAWP